MFTYIFSIKIFINSNLSIRAEVIKIKRKIVLHGPSTLTISLPTKWVKKFKVKKGDELNIEEYGRELRINTEKEFSPERKEINIGNLKKLGRTYLTSSYRQGYEEVELSYEDSEYIEAIQNIISREITGFEIIKQGKNSCLIRDIAGHGKDEFDIVLRRIWLLMLDLSEQSLNAIKRNDSANIKIINSIDYSINKFTNYCLRNLVKKGHINFGKTALYYHLIKSLEEIADKYKDLANFFTKEEKKSDKKTISTFNEVNKYLKEFYELYYKYDEQKIEDLFQKTKSTNSKISNSNDKTRFYLSSICEDIRNLLSVIVEINL